VHKLPIGHLFSNQIVGKLDLNTKYLYWEQNHNVKFYNLSQRRLPMHKREREREREKDKKSLNIPKRVIQFCFITISKTVNFIYMYVAISHGLAINWNKSNITENNL